MRQLKLMFVGKRAISTGILLAAIILTLIMALAVKSGVLTLLFTLVGWAAFAWYIISYIPYAQTCVMNCFKSCC